MHYYKIIFPDCNYVIGCSHTDLSLGSRFVYFYFTEGKLNNTWWEVVEIDSADETIYVEECKF